MLSYDDVLQWGHAFSGMDYGTVGIDTVYFVGASMGPCPFRHGYFRNSYLLDPALLGFNGAMPFQAWIRGTRSTKIAVDKSTSMGPCPFRHGYSAVRQSVSSWRSRFNGAMPFQAWIQGTRTIRYANINVLQWGHALSGMDTQDAVDQLFWHLN